MVRQRMHRITCEVAEDGKIAIYPSLCEIEGRGLVKRLFRLLARLVRLRRGK